MAAISSTLMVGAITAALEEAGQPTGEGGKAFERAFPRFVEDLQWWAEAARRQREHRAPPY